MAFKKLRRTNRFIWQILSSRPPRIAYVAGWNRHHNLGDEALYAALKLLFCPADFVDYPKGLETKLFLRSADAALLAGGTLIGGKVSTVEKAAHCFKICRRSVVFGTGVDNPNFWIERFGVSDWQNCKKQWKKVLQKSEYVGVRGPLSAEILVDLGLSKVEVIGDPVLAFARTELPSKNSWQADTIGFNIGETKGYMWGDQNQLCAQYIKLAMLARKAGFRIKWFVVWPRDLPITLQAAGSSNTTDDIYKIYEDYNTYLDLVKSVSIFVGMKLHSVALAMCNYVPSLMLEYRPKCRDFMKSIGQDEATIRTDSVRAEGVWEIVRAWAEQRQKISESLFRAITPIREHQLARATQLKKQWGWDGANVSVSEHNGHCKK